MKNIYKSYLAGAIMLLMATACADEKIGPKLPDGSTYVAPLIKNPATATAVELKAENAANVVEKFEWERTNYGLQLATLYTLEIDNDEDFSSPQKLAETSANFVNVTVEDLNDAMLALGLPGFKESMVFIRVKSTIVGLTSNPDRGITNTPLISAVVTRTATTFQNSECGNFCTIGIIGDATPGGWDKDTDLRLADVARVDKSTWTTTIYLIGGKKVKFRASDDWTDNWGGPDFATGTGTKNGSDINVPTSGYYKVTFNDNTGAYSFTALTTPEYPTVGVIGSATPGGWDSDTDLIKDPSNPHLWTGVITFTEGDAKFRANNAWDANWGSNTYPSGSGVINGPNIPVRAGTYAVRFNDATGEYFIMPQNSSTAFAKVGLVGPTQSGGWDADTDLVQNPSNPFLWSRVLTIKDGEAKFRADDAWTMNWGGSAFPSGVGLKDGPNIPAKDGTYFITFNSGTGEYYFLK